MRYQALSIPDWFRENVIYQINPRTFSEEGTLNAITKELPFINELGLKTVYLCPVFEADDSLNQSHWSDRQKKSQTGNPKNPYRIRNYFNIDEEYGTREDLIRLIDTAHELGMKVLLDLVYMHMGPEADIIKRHPEFAKLDENGQIVCNEYKFILLDFNSQGLREYLWANMVYLLSEFDADGFRLDVGDAVPADFWAEGRRRIQAIKADAVLLNEGSDMQRLSYCYDANYGIEWEHGLHQVIQGTKTLDELRKEYDEVASRIPEGGLVLRALETHDTVTDWPRAEALLGNAGMEMIQVMNCVMDGIPMVYCGNELADTAKVNMFANRFYKGEFEVTDRSRKHTEESLRRQMIFKTLSQLRQDCETIIKGSTNWVENSKPEDVLSFAREYEGKRIVFVGNFRDYEIDTTIETGANENDVLMKNNCTLTDNGLHMGRHGYILLEYMSTSFGIGCGIQLESSQTLS